MALQVARSEHVGVKLLQLHPDLQDPLIVILCWLAVALRHIVAACSSSGNRRLLIHTHDLRQSLCTCSEPSTIIHGRSLPHSDGLPSNALSIESLIKAVACPSHTRLSTSLHQSSYVMALSDDESLKMGRFYFLGCILSHAGRALALHGDSPYALLASGATPCLEGWRT